MQTQKRYKILKGSSKPKKHHNSALNPKVEMRQWLVGELRASLAQGTEYTGLLLCWRGALGEGL